MANSDQPSSKRLKLMRKPDRSVIDRLSNLPEYFLLHILSFLPTETAVATTVLSKSWQYLWTLVLNLDFDQSRSHPRDTYYRGFGNFVTRVLLLRRERFVCRFRLKCSSYQYSNDLDSWVSSAIAQNVQELDLDLGDDTYYHRFRLHCTTQSFKNLVVSKLRSVILDEVSLPALKIFHVEVARETIQFQVEYQEIKFLPSQFPVLEELVIVHNFVYLKANFEIYLPKLRSLAIHKRFGKGFVRIDCPALTHLVIEDDDSGEYHLENLLSLVKADINVRSYRVWNNKDKSYARYVMNVVKAVSNVRILRLSHYTMKEIELSRASSYSFFHLDHIPVFHNLVQVELPFIGCAWETIILMLQKFENLECLTLCYLGAHWKYGDVGIGRLRVDTKELIKQNHVPSCLTSRLTSFCFREFKGTNDEMEVTRYILENSPVLEYMTIFLSRWLNPFVKIKKTYVGPLQPPRGADLIFTREKDEGSS